MASGEKSAKVIPFPGPRRSQPAEPSGRALDPAAWHLSAIGRAAPHPAESKSQPGPAVSRVLQGLHPAVLAVLVARERTWELFERQDALAGRASILDRIPIADLLSILGRSAANAMAEQRAATPPVLQSADAMKRQVIAAADRITLSPWADFDLALLLRAGKARFALLLEPGTSIYIAEEALPVVACHFDGSGGLS